MPQIQDWIHLYSSKNPGVRHRGGEGLLRRPDEAPLNVLIDILTTLSSEGLGAQAEKALLRRRDDSLVPRMIVLLDSKDDFVREVACNVLGRSGGKLAAPHLLRMLDDPRMMVRRAAGFGLAFLKDSTSLPALRQRMERHKHDDTNVVAALQCALSSLEGNADPSQQGVGKPDFIAEYQTTSYNRLSAQTATWLRCLPNGWQKCSSFRRFTPRRCCRFLFARLALSCGWRR